MNGKNLIFLISLPRSGSTLLQKMLSAGPEIHSVAEPWLMLPLAFMLKKEEMFTPYSHKIASNALEDLINELPNGKKDFYEEINKFAISLYKKMIPDGTNKYFLDKTPRYYLIIPFLAEVFPDAKFIFLFRNPLEVLSSILTTWKRDRFILYKQYVDLYCGPHALSNGYKLLGDRAISVNYAELVKSPEVQMQKICSYLEIPFDQSTINNYKSVDFSGSCGDTTGIHQFESVSTSSLEKWKTILNTHYRKWFSKRYVRYLGNETLMNFGTSVNELTHEINSITQLRSGSFQDAYYHFLSNAMRFGNLELFRKSYRSALKNERFYPYI